MCHFNSPMRHTSSTARSSATSSSWCLNALGRNIDEAFVFHHLDSAMQLAAALYCEDNIEAERTVELICDADRQEFLILAVELRRLVEIAVRDHMTFLLSSVASDEAAASKTELVKQQTLVQSLPDAFQLRFRQLLELHWNALMQAAKNTTFSLPRVQQLHWKVAMESDTGKRVLMRLQTSDGKTQTIHVPMQQFHQLRHSVATVLQEMNEVEAHPMMRLAHMDQTSTVHETG